MDYIIAKKENVTVKLLLSEILYIGTKADNPRVLQFVTDDGIYEAYGKLKELDDRMGVTFNRCHRKYLVNLKRVKAIDADSRKIIFDNEHVEAIEGSRRKLTASFKAWMSI